MNKKVHLTFLSRCNKHERGALFSQSLIFQHDEKLEESRLSKHRPIKVQITRKDKIKRVLCGLNERAC